MLKQRVITALVLLALLIPVVAYHDHRLFAAVALLFIGCAAWELGRLCGLGGNGAIATGVVAVILGCILWAAGALVVSVSTVWLLATAFWVPFSAWVLRHGAPAWLAVPRAVRVGGGLLVLLMAWLAVSKAHSIGLNFLFSVLFLVWAADVGAYFAGRGFGGRLFNRKLAPTISPGKTWEGVLGGMSTVLLVAAFWQWGEAHYAWGAPSLFARLAAQGWFFFGVSLCFLVSMSVVGDLVESLLKRSVGAKDSSNLLPGHGGVLDRIDALLPVLPMAMLLGTV